MTRLLAVPLDASDVFLMTFMILQDSYMEPTRVGSDHAYVSLSPPYTYTLLFKAGSDTYARCEHSYSYNTHQVAYLDFHTCVCVCVQQFCTFQVMLYGDGHFNIHGNTCLTRSPFLGRTRPAVLVVGM